MSDDRLIIHFFDFVNKRDMNKFKDLLTENAEFYFPKTRPLIGKDQIIRFFNILFRQYPELAFTTHSKIIQGQRAAVHWTNHGVNRRGESYENEGVTLLETEKDKIRSISDFFKDTEKF